MAKTLSHILESTLDKSALQKVRVKVDPTFTNTHNITFDIASDYEGYILEEGDDIVKVLVVRADDTTQSDIMDIPTDSIELISSQISENFTDFKDYFTQSIIYTCGKRQPISESIISMIRDAVDPLELRNVCELLNIDENELLRHYEEYVKL